ncbi:hypothetical protein, partial [Porphyromonas sp. HMSC077F02]|uniref:hypothetical protein n=1 Tax=Porphyromonas sp. HMSC077F02 TaxID=1739529 RepID=UPI001AEF4D5C
DLSLEVSYALRATASFSIDAPIISTHKTILMRNPWRNLCTISAGVTLSQIKINASINGLA